MLVATGREHKTRDRRYDLRLERTTFSQLVPISLGANLLFSITFVSSETKMNDLQPMESTKIHGESKGKHVFCNKCLDSYATLSFQINTLKLGDALVNFVKPCHGLPLCYFNIYVLQGATSHVRYMFVSKYTDHMRHTCRFPFDCGLF